MLEPDTNLQNFWSQFSNTGWKVYFMLLPCMLHALAPTKPTIQEVLGIIFSGIEGPHLELAADLHLVTKFRGHGDLLTFFQISSWHCAETQDFIFTWHVILTVVLANMPQMFTVHMFCNLFPVIVINLCV